MYHAKSSKFLTFSIFFLLKFSQFYPSSAATFRCDGDGRTCQDILKKRVFQPPECTEDSSQDVFSNFSIDDTQLLQPWITLIANPDTLQTESEEIELGIEEGYVIGYRDCTVTSSHCYVYRASLPIAEENWTHTIEPKNNEVDNLSPGEQCTFFGCVLHTFVDVYDPSNCARRVLQDFLNKTITIVATCPDPGVSVENGSFSITFPPNRTGDVYVEGTVVNVTCDEGFVATYGGVSECQRDGNWTTSKIPTCKRQCDEFTESIDGGRLEPSDETRIVNTNITASCYAGYYSNGSAICDEEGNWTSPPSCLPIRCERLNEEDVKHGEVDVNSSSSISEPTGEYYLANTTVTLTCDEDEGYVGGGSIVCGMDMNWTLPRCSPLNCSEPEERVMYGTVLKENESYYLVNETLRVMCDKGYSGEGEVVCGTDGTWIFNGSPCSKYCSEPEEHVDYGTVQKKPHYYDEENESYYLVNETLRVMCDKGFSGGGEVVCGTNGTWIFSGSPCSKDVLPVAVAVTVILAVLLIAASVITLICYRRYRSYRNDKIRRFNRVFTIQARKESLDPNYTPVDLSQHKKVSISLSIRTANEYYEISANSITTPTVTTPLQEEFEQLTTKFQSLEGVSNPLPLAQSNVLATGSYIKDPTVVSTDTTDAMPSTEKVPIATKPSKIIGESSDIIFHLSDSSSGVGSGSGQYNSPTDHSGIGFEFTDTSSAYPASTGRPSHEPSPEESTESGSTSDTDIPQSDAPQADNSNLQDSTAETAPLYDLGYANISETSPLSPPTPSDVTLAFAMVEQPAGSVKPHHLPSSEPQLDNGTGFEPSSGYMNSCTSSSGYVGEFTSSYTVESASGRDESTTGYIGGSSTGNSSSGYIGGSSVGISSSDYIIDDTDYVGQQSEGTFDYGAQHDSNTGSNDDFNSQQYPPSSTYIKESDLSNATSVHSNNIFAAALETIQPTTDNEDSAGHYIYQVPQANSGLPNHVVLGKPNTSSTA